MVASGQPFPRQVLEIRLAEAMIHCSAWLSPCSASTRFFQHRTSGRAVPAQHPREPELPPHSCPQGPDGQPGLETPEGKCG